MEQPAHPASTSPGKKLLDQYLDALRLKHDSACTEKTYLEWIKRTLHALPLPRQTPPQNLGIQEIQAYLTHFLQNGYDIRTVQRLLAHKAPP